MSRIYEALQNAKATRLKVGTADSLGVMELPERRQIGRVVSVPLTVYGRALSGSPFYQEADGIGGNADGGLIALCMAVLEGQDLLLINNCTSIEQMCRVMHIHSRDAKTNEVGIAFSSPNKEFWQVPKSAVKRQEKHWDDDF
jgi:hypothetical protein